MVTLGVLTVAVKAGCSFEVFSYVRAVSMTLTAQKFPCEMSMCISTAQARTNRVSWGPLFRRARFTSARYVHNVWQALHFPDILSAGQAWHFLHLAWFKTRGGFGGHFSWHVQCLVNLDDALKGSKVSFCETVVIVDFGRNDMIPLWQVQHFGCPGFIFRGRRSTLQTSTKKRSRPR